MFLSGLRKNWRNGNFRIADVSRPLNSFLTFSCRYFDFIMWHFYESRNSWRLCWFDVSVGSLRYGRLVYQSWSNRMKRCAIETILIASKSIAVVLLLDQTGARQVWAVDITDPEEIKTIWTSPVSPVYEIWRIRVVGPKVMLCCWSGNAHSLKILDATTGGLLEVADLPVPEGGLFDNWFDREVEPADLSVAALMREFRGGFHPSVLLHDTWVSFSKASMMFLSSDAHGGEVRNVTKQLELPSGKPARIEEIWCLSTAVLAFVQTDSEDLLVALDFKP